MVIFMVAFIILILLGVPIGFALGIGSITFILTGTTMPPMVVVQKMFSGIDSFPLLAIPFFIIAGGLMNTGGVTKRLLNFANILVGHWRGGLPAISIVGSMVFAGISGSSVADASGIGSILIPAMNKEGYEPEYSVAINATSSTIGTIIPPSISMVVLGTLTGTSVRDLFMAGAIPGIIIGTGMLILNAYFSAKKNYPRNKRVELKEAIHIVISSIPAIIMPLFIIVGIISGIVTPTEASVIAVIYALIVGKYLYKELSWKKIYETILEAGIQTSVVLFIIATASVLSYVLSYLLLPQALALWATETLTSRWMILLFIAVVALLLGTVIDASPGIILLGSIFAPVAQTAGIDMMQFGVVLVIALVIGLYTPPVGTTLIISSYISKTSVLSSFRYCIPFLIEMLIVLLLLIIFPAISTFLPDLLFYSA